MSRCHRMGQVSTSGPRINRHLVHSQSCEVRRYFHVLSQRHPRQLEALCSLFLGLRSHGAGTHLKQSSPDGGGPCHQARSHRLSGRSLTGQGHPAFPPRLLSAPLCPLQTEEGGNLPGLPLGRGRLGGTYLSSDRCATLSSPQEISPARQEGPNGTRTPAGRGSRRPRQKSGSRERPARYRTRGTWDLEDGLGPARCSHFSTATHWLSSTLLSLPRPQCSRL